MRKSVSMGNLSQHVESGGASAEILNGYASDGFDHGSSSRERKKGTAWTKEEHKHFLLGLEVFGKGDWRGIARAFVPSRTPTQVASHAQKYFNRLNHHQISRRRRSSVFDMALEEVPDARTLAVHDQEKESGADVLTAAAACPPPPPQHLEREHKGNSSVVPNAPATSNFSSPFYHMYRVPFAPRHPSFGSINRELAAPTPMSISNAPSIVIPTAVHCTSSTNLNELVGTTKLNVFEKGNGSSSSAPVDIVPNSDRHSAFHSSNSNRDGSGSPINLNLSPIHAL